MNYSGIFYATIKTGDILSQLVSEDILKEGYVRLYDSNDNLLIDYRQDGPKNKKYQVISYKSTSMRVEVGIPDSLIMQRLKPVYTILQVYLLAMILISVILASFFAYRNSYPIRRLMGIVNRIPHVSLQQAGKLNEYDYIANAVTSLDQKVDTGKDH